MYFNNTGEYCFVGVNSWACALRLQSDHMMVISMLCDII